ncbi:hypothetical protein MMC14_003686 [Varicellaria rhodocarpa]|nr:hypothetical protein [Varicellaria rhodocarpa]
MNQPSETPALAPPPGVIPNFVHPASIRKYNILCQAICLPLSTVFVCMRMYTRSYVSRNLGAEDYTCCVAWLGLIAYAIICLESDKYGAGVHEWDVSKSNGRKWAYLSNISEIVYGPLILVTKASILLLYMRIFAPHRKSRTYVLIYLLLWFNVLFYIPITVVKIVECIPRARIWDKSIPGRCIDFEPLLYTTSIVNLCSDLSILVLPIESIWRLQMKTARKIGVSAAFTAGLFATVASAVRLEKSITGGANPDATYHLFQVQLWTEIEITTGIVCGCLPILPALFRHLIPKVQSKASSSASSHFPKLGKRSFHSSRHSKGASKYLGPDDPRLLHAEYLELGEGNYQKTHDGPRGGTVTTIQGGMSSEDNDTITTDSQPDTEYSRSKGEITAAGTGILKTVRVESRFQGEPQPIPHDLTNTDQR